MAVDWVLIVCSELLPVVRTLFGTLWSKIIIKYNKIIISKIK